MARTLPGASPTVTESIPVDESAAALHSLHRPGRGGAVARVEFGARDRGREADGAGPDLAGNDPDPGDAAHRHDAGGHRLFLARVAGDLFQFAPGRGGEPSARARR